MLLVKVESADMLLILAKSVHIHLLMVIDSVFRGISTSDRGHNARFAQLRGVIARNVFLTLFLDPAFTIKVVGIDIFIQLFRIVVYF